MEHTRIVKLERLISGDYEFDLNKECMPGLVSIYIAGRVEDLGKGKPLLVSSSENVRITHPRDRVRRYFKLVSEAGIDRYLAERAVPFQGSVNFRDLGGYHTENNRVVKWGKLYRSGHLSNLTDEDKFLFLSLGIDSVCDFRVEEERKAESASLPGEPEFYYSPIVPGIGHDRYFHDLFKRTDDVDEVVEKMHDIMIDFVSNSDSNYMILFNSLLLKGGKNFLINCSAGKERTGVGAALLLLVLGVPEDRVREDFMLSKRYFPYERELKRIYDKYELDPADPKSRLLVDPLLITRESYINCVFRYIEEKYDALDQFFERKLGLTREKITYLRSLYTF